MFTSIEYVKVCIEKIALSISNCKSPCVKGISPYIACRTPFAFRFIESFTKNWTPLAFRLSETFTKYRTKGESKG